jgi:hypothetical protein
MDPYGTRNNLTAIHVEISLHVVVPDFIPEHSIKKGPFYAGRVAIDNLCCADWITDGIYNPLQRFYLQRW